MLGTSLPPVRSTASRIARARALKEASALHEIDAYGCTCESAAGGPWKGRKIKGGRRGSRGLHVVVVDTPDGVDVKRDARGGGERLEDVRDHLGRDWQGRKGSRAACVSSQGEEETGGYMGGATNGLRSSRA